MDYKNAKIYRIVCNLTGENYYGSTTQSLSKRLSKHKVKKPKYDTRAREIIDRGDYSMVLVEEFPCENKDQLHKRERYYIENNECLNFAIPTRSKNELSEYKRDEILAKRKKWREENKERIVEQRKKWQENTKNKENAAKQQKNWREKNKERVAEYAGKKVTCECGCVVTSSCLSRHMKSLKHLNTITSIS